MAETEDGRVVKKYADSIAAQLRSNKFFATYDLQVKPKEFIHVALQSGLINTIENKYNHTDKP